MFKNLVIVFLTVMLGISVLFHINSARILDEFHNNAKTIISNLQKDIINDVYHEIPSITQYRVEQYKEHLDTLK